MNTVQGGAMDVARGVAANYEGGNAGFTELFKSGDIMKALGVGEAALLENYNANAPRERGMYTQTIGGNKAVGDFFSNSYFGAGLSGMADYSFSGNGNNPLITGDANRNVVTQRENFNPFGFRDPIRGMFDTGALEAQERAQGKQPFTHGYDQYLKGGLGLITDIVLSARVDKAVVTALKGTKAITPATTRVSQAGIKALRNDVPRPLPVGLPQLQGRTQLQLPPAREIPKGTWVTPPTGSPAPLARVSNGKLSNSADPLMDAYINRAREYYANKARGTDTAKLQSGSRDLMRRRQDYHAPVNERYLPYQVDPLITKPVRAYHPRSGLGGVDFMEDYGGAIIPYSGSNAVVPAVLGVGGAPGGIPVKPRASVTTTLKATPANSGPAVTVWDEASNTFIATGKSSGATTERVFVSPGKSSPLPVVDDIIEGTVVDTKALPQGVSSKSPVQDINNPTLITPANPTEGLVPPVGRNTPEVTQTPLPGPVSGLSESVSNVSPSRKYTIDPITGEFTRNRAPVVDNTQFTQPSDDIWEAAFRADEEADALLRAIDDRADVLLGVNNVPPLVPRSTPNYTVTPIGKLSDDLASSHVMDPLTGVFSDSDDVIRVATQRTVSAGKVSEVPVPKLEYVTAEAISPSVNSADIVRRLTSGDDIPGATYNPLQVERGERSISSLVSLARRVTLPGGVPILSDSIKDISVMKFSRLTKKVEAAIIASGMNPSSSEAASIRRLFDKNGKAIPTNLSPDFNVQVGARGVDNPATYVTPAKLPESQWTGRASRYEPTVPLSEDYAIGVRVRYDKELDRIVPLDGGIEAKMIPAVRSEPISGARLRELPVIDRQAVLSKSATDGFTLPKGAVEDALSPDIVDDIVAAKDYVKANIPKGDAPLKLDRATREQLGKHQSIVEDIDYHNSLIEDVSTQLTDVERSLNIQLQRIDEQLPDIGTQHLADDVPLSPLLPSTRKTVQSILHDMENVSDVGSIPAPGIVPYGVSNADGTMTLARGKVSSNPRNSVIQLTPDEITRANFQHDTFGYNFKDIPGVNDNRTFITDVDGMTSGIGKIPSGLDDTTIQKMFSGGSYLTPTLRHTGVDTFEVLSGGDYIAAYKRAMDLGDVVDRMSVRMVGIDINETTGLVSGGKVGSNLYHGTRVQDLQLRGVNPLEGAARSEYGTGVWLTTKESVATSAAGRRAPNNHIPNVNRTYSEDAFIHTVQGDSLDGLRVVNSVDQVADDVSSDIITQLDMNTTVFSDEIVYGEEILGDIVEMLLDSKSKGLSYGDLFGRVDDLVHSAALRNTGSRADEFELTYIQRVFTDMLQSSGVDGITNGTNTALYTTRNLTTRAINNVTDVVGDSGDEVSLALHNVNLLQASSDAAPSSKLLKVQLEEAKAVAASRVRDQLSDELDNLNAYKSKAMSDLLDQDDVVREIGRSQQGEALLAATIRNDDTYAKFSKELNKDFTGPCL
jgi:hypothetical protein